MKKVLAIILSAITLISTAAVASAKSDEGTIELTMWTMHTTEAMINTLNAQVDAFEAENPSIKINIETLTYDVVYQRMMASMHFRH